VGEVGPLSMSPDPPGASTGSAAARTPSERAADAISRPSHLPVIDGAGEYASFMLRGIRGIGGVGKYTSEVLRQTALLAAGSLLVIVAVSFMAGATCGIEGSALSQALGVGIAAPIFSAFCTTREVVPFVFGFIVAAKIGGGIVAQIGAMRVNEEVDAMGVMGVSSIVYLFSTRMVAAMVMLPVIYLVALAAGQAASWLTSFVRFADISQGTWEFAFYTALDPLDIVYSVTKGIVISFFVIVTALYFGYRVRGGPVEVGVATAQSMAVNLVLVTVLNMTMTFIFWGFNPNLPVA
jgi:phospholipid/cholesterol/gamma-HCH transport system permease protein